MRTRTWTTLVFIILLAILATWVALPGSNYDINGFRAAHPIREGLDLQGGLQVVLQANPVAGQTLDKDTLEGTRQTLEKRINALGVSEQRLARYCRPIEARFIEALEARRPKTMSDVRDAWYGRSGETPSRYHSSRYHGLNLNSLFFRGTLEFRYFNGTLHAGEVKAYVQLVLAIAAKALSSKAASSKRREFNPATAKYDFRVVLLHLGLIGDEFKTARLHLTKKLAGSAAWKGERRDRRPAASAPASEEVGDARAAA